MSEEESVALLVVVLCLGEQNKVASCNLLFGCGYFFEVCDLGEVVRHGGDGDESIFADVVDAVGVGLDVN